MDTKNTSMEKIKAFHSIKCYLNEEQRQQVSEMLDLSEIDITKRIWGKDNEVEFILMIYLLQGCKDIVGYEEGVAQLTNTVASDLYVELTNGERIIVEIKSTEKEKYSISEKNLKGKIEFADKMNASLYFAIKICGYWVVHSSDYLIGNNRRITVDKDFMSSKLNKIFGDRTFILPDGLKIISIYSKKATKHLDIKNPEYGYLVKYKIEYLGRKIITINSNQHEKYPLIFMYGNLQDTMSIQKQEVTKMDGDKTMVTEEFVNEMNMMNLSTFILAPIRHLINELGHVYDFHQYLIKLIDGNYNLITRTHVLDALEFLHNNHYPVLETRDNKIYKFQRNGEKGF